MTSVNWIKSTNGLWCSLLDLNLNNPHFNNLEGVYIIWHGGNGHNVVRVGQGVVKDRLAKHRQDSQIVSYANPQLFVTWAKIDAFNRDGVERYLAEFYNPKIGDRFPLVSSVVVNLPQ